MKALSTLKSAINQSSFIGIIALVTLGPVMFPGFIAHAAELQTQGQQSQIFEIKITDPSVLNSNSQNSLTLDTVQQADPLYSSLQSYLQKYNSPLKDYTGQLLTHDNWPTIVAISFVESNMCVHNYYYNCSGIGGQEYLRKYNNYGEWIDDMSNVLTQRYQGWSLDKMDGVYVQPKSNNWALGSKKILAELTTLQQNANEQRAQIAQASVSLDQSNKELATIAQ